LDKLKQAKTVDSMTSLIRDSLPGRDGHIYRIHVAGDFFSKDYLEAWINVANQFPNQIFYAYTKSIPFWIALMSKIPKNFILTASYGGKYDSLIEPYQLKSAKVVFTVEEAEQLGLEIDHDDSHAYIGKKSFALLLHGKQKAGTKAAKALNDLKKQGHKGYARVK
jgi:hypothetical protein